jgi:hypothetical protein
MRKLLLKRLILVLLFLTSQIYSQVTINSVDDLLTATEWNSLFPKRAGTYGTHPQGYTTDFYSYNNLKQAINEMSDYLVLIRKKQGVWGELITITKKSTNITYVYSDVESWWYSNSTPETIINVDFADFVNKSSSYNNKRELAAFLANISKETTGGWQLPVGGGSGGDYADWGLYFVHEVGYSSSNSAGAYSQSHNDYPPNPTKGYYGRGPIQLSWNYNYGQFSKFLYNDASILLNNPDLVQQDGVLAFKSAIWFWMMPQCPKPSCHQAMHEIWEPQIGEYVSNKMYKKGFAHTNNIINGGLECRNTSTATFTEKVVLRSELYKYYLEILGFNSSQINLENTGDYSTLCYESTSNTMENYINCAITTLGTEEFSLNNVILYPNPTAEKVTISSLQFIQKIEIYNVLGQLKLTQDINSNEAIIDLSNLINGSYLLKINIEDNIITKKIVVK